MHVACYILLSISSKRSHRNKRKIELRNNSPPPPPFIKCTFLFWPAMLAVHLDCFCELRSLRDVSHQKKKQAAR